MPQASFNFHNSYLELPSALYSRVNPTPVRNPQTVIFNTELATQLNIELSNTPQRTAILSGNVLPAGAEPIAQAYAGHQFGNFTILGDGRAILLGEHLTKDGRRFDIQLKGAGLTPYSRRADGRAALGPMLREYIISEAMHHLGIATTRSLSVVATGENIIREQLIPGAVLTRVASSHLRVGTFEFVASTGDIGLLQQLLDYALKRHFPKEIAAENQALAFIKAVMNLQADLIVDWMRVGFVHGVMNTDNMSISGETLDYGPCAFLDSFDYNKTFSSIDHYGRYAFGRQASIAQWNLARLAETLLPLIHNNLDEAVSLAEGCANEFSTIYQAKWLSMMKAKLGLTTAHANDIELITQLLGWMQHNYADYTNTFRKLLKSLHNTNEQHIEPGLTSWYKRWINRLEIEPSLDDSVNLMSRYNPVIIPRNHTVEKVLLAAQTANFEPLDNLLKALQSPYLECETNRNYLRPPSPGEQVYQTFCGT